MTWDTDGPDVERDAEGVPLCSTPGCGQTATNSETVECGGCSLAAVQADLVIEFEATAQAALAIKAAAMDRIREQIRAQGFPEQADQAEMVQASDQARDAISSARRAAVYADAWQRPHTHQTFACADHREV